MKKFGLVLFLFLLTPGIALAFYKPSRVFVPGAFGLVCLKQNICLEDEEKVDVAERLVRSSIEDLRRKYSLVIDQPKVIFCSSEKCKNYFGLGRRAAYTLGTFGIVISPCAWQSHYLKHELIHYWQAKKFGNLALLTGEKWVIEGMAYSLSDDPREHLSEPFESYRREFRNWYKTVQTDSIASAIKQEL